MLIVPNESYVTRYAPEKFSGLWRNGPQARVAQSIVSANQCYLAGKRIGFDTSQPMISANHSSNRPLDFSGASKNSVGLKVDLKLCLRHFSFPSA